MLRSNIDFDYQIRLLSEKFFNDYPNKKYPEITLKERRAFNFFIFETRYDYYIAVPFRSKISHKNAYLFKNSKRSRITKSGIDYSKMLIIKNPEYISGEGYIDKDEFNEFEKNIKEIAEKSLKYLEDYIKNYSNPKDRRSFDRKYKYTTLKYFHKELNLE